MPHYKNLVAGLLLPSLSLSIAYAAEQQDAIVVTATRTAQTADDTLASVTVITQEDIQQQQAQDLVELLSGLAGIDISSNGGYGKSANLYLRGTNTGHTLLLIDGVQVGSATLGQAAFENIPLELVERIEIVRGPHASLYGADALGGVIQVFTRRPENKTHWQVNASSGSEKVRKLSAGISGKQGDTSYSLNTSHFETEGFNARVGNNPDLDGYEQQAVNASLRHQFNNTDYLEASLLNSTGKNDYDGFVSTSDYWSETEQKVMGLKSVFNASNEWQLTLSLNETRDNNDEFADNLKTDVFNTRRRSLLWQNDLSLGENMILTLGAEKQDTDITSTTAYQETSRTNDAVFVQHNWNGVKNNILVSARMDDNEAFGQHTTGSLSWGYHLGDTARIIASAGTAFKAPSFNDLYWPDSGFSRGNPDVLPEESKNIELGFKQQNWQISIYRNKIENLIAWDNSSGVWMPDNVNNATIEGAELQFNAVLAGWHSNLQLSVVNPRDDNTGDVLNNRVKESARINMDRDFGNFSLGGTISAHGKRYGFVQVDGHTLLDLRAGYQLAKNWQLQARINNALDKEYQAVSGYNTLQRNALVTINYQY